MLEALFVGKKVLLFFICPIRWLVSQVLVVSLYPGDEVLGFFSLPGPHVTWAVYSEFRGQGRGQGVGGEPG